jgi:hypothetical protein
MSVARSWLRIAAVLLLCLPGSLALAQYGNRATFARARFAQDHPRAAARQQARQQRQQARRQNRYQPPQNPNRGQRPPADYRPGAPGVAPNSMNRPVYPGAGRPGSGYPGYAPPGHLQDWLNQHHNMPIQDQERLLRNDPVFTRQAPAEQQREVQQLHHLNQMSEQQRQLRLARSEMLERLSPQDRLNLSSASRQFATLPPDRRQVMTRAFHDLRAVPPDQRDTVLNSARFQSQFSPQERGILSNFLRIEPYEPAR